MLEEKTPSGDATCLEYKHHTRSDADNTLARPLVLSEPSIPSFFSNPQTFAQKIIPRFDNSRVLSLGAYVGLSMDPLVKAYELA